MDASLLPNRYSSKPADTRSWLQGRAGTQRAERSPPPLPPHTPPPRPAASLTPKHSTKHPQPTRLTPAKQSSQHPCRSPAGRATSAVHSKPQQAGRSAVRRGNAAAYPHPAHKQVTLAADFGIGASSPHPCSTASHRCSSPTGASQGPDMGRGLLPTWVLSHARGWGGTYPARTAG